MKEAKTNDKIKLNKKLVFYALILTICAFIILGIISVMIFGEDNVNKAYDIPNSYSFSGKILSTTLVYPEISLIIEERNSNIYGITLKNNEMVAEKCFVKDLDYSGLVDFEVILDDYNDDNNKDFTYINEKVDNGYIYKFYSIDRKGNIADAGIEDVTADIMKSSVKLTKQNGKYEYILPTFYYDGYKVPAEIGKYKLEEKININKKAISKTSRIITEGRYNPLPRKITVLKDIPEYIKNVNSYLINSDKMQCIEMDLDDNKQKEYIISFVKDNKTYISLFDSSANFIVNLITIDGNKDINQLVEVADVNDDNIMEIIVINDKSLEVHRYNNGFYY